MEASDGVRIRARPLLTQTRVDGDAVPGREEGGEAGLRSSSPVSALWRGALAGRGGRAPSAKFCLTRTVRAVEPSPIEMQSTPLRNSSWRAVVLPPPAAAACISPCDERVY